MLFDPCNFVNFLVVGPKIGWKNMTMLGQYFINVRPNVRRNFVGFNVEECFCKMYGQIILERNFVINKKPDYIGMEI